jgi:hypothetical protein
MGTGGGTTSGSGGGTTTTTTSGSGGSGGSGGATTGTGGTGGTGGTTGTGGTGGSTTGTGGTGGTGGAGGTTGTGGTGGTGGSTTGTGGTGGMGTGGSGGGTPGCTIDADCQNGVFCDGVEACVNGSCVAGFAACDDGIACTMDVCNEAMQMCGVVEMDALCDDGILCNGMEACDSVNGCVAGAPADCSDNISCTADFCDTATDACTHVAQDQACDDNVFCNGVESCSVSLGCQPGATPSCNDGVACTTDTCSAGTDACVHTPNDGACSNNQFCDGAETCDPVQGCVAGTAPSCSDNIACTADSCNPANGGACAHAANNAACSDGLFCDGAEICSTSQGCIDGPDPTCAPDAFACTIESCDDSVPGCISTPSNAICGPGMLCKPTFPGHDAAGCIVGQACTMDSECQDGDLCNGAEVCLNDVCSGGTPPPPCNDGIDCTTDWCNPATGLCEETENDNFCDDGLGCNGAEFCDMAVDCVAGTPMVCGDAFACTVDSCAEPGVCVYAPQNSDCADGNPCNGNEVCNPASGCQPGTGTACADDGIACTDESCDPILGCLHKPNDLSCPIGQSCDPLGGCGNWCTVRTCQGKVYACGDCMDNDSDHYIDGADSQCLGPCDNTEESFYGGIPGQNNSPCKSDCYFDQDTGAGNDDCYWSHKCDPLEVAPSYPPEGSQCSYNPGSNIPGFGGSCTDAFNTQSATCGSYCGPLTPNGCDCFGCCFIPGAPTTVWLGSEEPAGTGSCNINTLNDPTKCKPCTQVPACLNPCDPANCELCIGQTQLPPGCTSQTCPAGRAKCGQPLDPACPTGEYFITGCCQPLPQ